MNLEERLAANRPVLSISRAHRFFPAILLILLIELVLAYALPFTINKYYVLTISGFIVLFLFFFYIGKQSQYYEKNLSYRQTVLLYFLNQLFCLLLLVVFVFPSLILQYRIKEVPNEKFESDKLAIRLINAPDYQLQYIRDSIFIKHAYDSVNLEVDSMYEGLSRDHFILSDFSNMYGSDYTTSDSTGSAGRPARYQIPAEVQDIVMKKPQNYFDSLRNKQGMLLSFYGLTKRSNSESRHNNDDVFIERSYFYQLAGDFSNIEINRSFLTGFSDLLLLIVIPYVFVFFFPAIAVVVLMARKRNISILVTIAYAFATVVYFAFLSKYDKAVLISLSILFSVNILLMILSKLRKWDTVFAICLHLLFYFLLIVLYVLTFAGLQLVFDEENIILRRDNFIELFLTTSVCIITASLLYLLFIKIYYRILHYPSK